MGNSEKKIYIAGRITGYKEFKKHFGKAESMLKNFGYIVLNPAELPTGLSQEEYMIICIPMLQICDAIYMLEGWEDSVGANIEHSLAKQAGKKIFYEEE